MDFWGTEREKIAHRIMEIETKIVQWERRARNTGDLAIDKEMAERTLVVLRDSLDRARLHVRYIEHHLEKQPELDARRAALRASLDAAASPWANGVKN